MLIYVQNLFLFLFLFVSWSASAQLRLNEAVGSNSVFADEDGDTPDWFEIYNPGPALNLQGWTVSDDAAEPTKWVFPDLEIAAGEHLVVWASDKDRAWTGDLRGLVKRGDEARYLVPQAAVPSAWIEPGFDDSAWASGPSGFGFGDDDDATEIPRGTLSVFIRHTFNASDIDEIRQLLFHVDYDDGFVAYLNGQEIARANMNRGRPAYGARTTTYTDPLMAAGLPPELYIVEAGNNLLREGENVLAVQVHNVSDGSSDLTMIAYLTARFAGTSTAGTEPPGELPISTGNPHTNFKLSSGGETLYLFDPDGHLVSDLTIPELPNGLSAGIPAGDNSVRIYDEPSPGEPNPGRGYAGHLPATVEFSEPGGVFDASFELRLSGAPAGAEIRYTLDATAPGPGSTRYAGPISVNGQMVVRAAIFQHDYVPSRPQTETFLVGADHELDVVALTVEPDDFFDPQEGIYVLGAGYQGSFPFFDSNIWRDVEVPLHFAFHPTSGDGFAQDVGTKIFGNYSRGHPQRSLALHARNRYGDGDMDYPFFDDRPYDEYHSLVLRNSGNDWLRSMLRDRLLTGIMDGSGVDVQAARPVVAYLNAEYWGIYNLREKVNEDFLASRYAIDPDGIDLLAGEGEVVEGSANDYFGLIDFISARDLRVSANYAYVTERIDVDNFIKYQLGQIYFDNRDWPGNNIKFWRSAELDNQWRWIMYDTDFGAGIWSEWAAYSNTLEFALEPGGTGWPNPDWSTLMLRKLTENETFRHRFINQFADEMNTRFIPSRIRARITDHAADIRSEMPRAADRWDQDLRFEEEVNRLTNFFNDRPTQMKEFIEDQWNIPSHHAVNIINGDPVAGYVELNSLTLRDGNWQGDYFEDVPIRIKAVALPGYVFSHWKRGSDSREAEIWPNIQAPTSFEPVWAVDLTNTESVDRPAGLRSVVNVTVSPNPSNGLARIAFQTLRRTRVRANLYDGQGRDVVSIVDAELAAGSHNFDLRVAALPAGTYTIRFVEDGARSGALNWIKQ